MDEKEELLGVELEAKTDIWLYVGVFVGSLLGNLLGGIVARLIF